MVILIKDELKCVEQELEKLNDHVLELLASQSVLNAAQTVLQLEHNLQAEGRRLDLVLL